jgi:hypothetical protein
MLMLQCKAGSGTITSQNLHLGKRPQSQQWHHHIFVFVSIHESTATQKEW